MKRLVWLLSTALALAVSASAQGLPQSAPGNVGMSLERLERIDAVLEGWVKEKKYAGVAAAVARRGRIAYFRTFGFRDAEADAALQIDTIYRFYSMTKPIASTAAMILHEEGRFLLDDPVSEYLPEFADLQVLAAEDGDSSQLVPREGEVTIKHLLTHTSGLSNSEAYDAKGVFDRDITLEQMQQRLAGVPLAHQPGAAWRYGQSINVIGRLVEVLSGKTFDQFLRDRIFDPLLMPDTAFYVPASKAARMAKLYQLDDAGGIEPYPFDYDDSAKPAFYSGGGGLYSTAADYIRFCQMLLNKGELDGARIVSPKTVEIMMLNHVAEDVLPPKGPNGRTGYGFGIGGAVLMDVAKSGQLASKGEYNWGGKAGTYFWIDPQERLIGLFLVQRPGFVPGPPKTLKNLVYQALLN